MGAIEFRLDIPVVFIDMKLPVHNGGVCEAILPTLKLWYKGDQESVRSFIAFWTAYRFIHAASCRNGGIGEEEEEHQPEAHSFSPG